MENKGFVFFDERMEGCRERQRRLQGEDRGDEANFERIRENVYDIFKTVVSVAVKKCGGDCRKAREFFEERLEGIPSKWESSFEKAKRFDDVEKMHVESVKLEVVKDVKENISRIWGESA